MAEEADLVEGAAGEVGGLEEEVLEVGREERGGDGGRVRGVAVVAGVGGDDLATGDGVDLLERREKKIEIEIKTVRVRS